MSRGCWRRVPAAELRWCSLLLRFSGARRQGWTSGFVLPDGGGRWDDGRCGVVARGSGGARLGLPLDDCAPDAEALVVRVKGVGEDDSLSGRKGGEDGRVMRWKRMVYVK